ncbi:hypothetical protein RHMOL_Rhmol05G0170700 [Rhododendron molle]|uniref:Uncharacterized protein n=1 Tax=Rhododendron molle TaxID=49168 RepID=A0ACC0NS12_RHOML|nr:hypothetical protein RHMOL_Rhmol05G0170700 [Rhododendron molle]
MVLLFLFLSFNQSYVPVSFYSWGNNTIWESSPLTADLEWKEIVEPVMKSNTEATDGSDIEINESALVWHHHDSDPTSLGIVGSFDMSIGYKLLEPIPVQQLALVWHHDGADPTS